MYNILKNLKSNVNDNDNKNDNKNKNKNKTNIYSQSQVQLYDNPKTKRNYGFRLPYNYIKSVCPFKHKSGIYYNLLTRCSNC